MGMQSESPGPSFMTHAVSEMKERLLVMAPSVSIRLVCSDIAPKTPKIKLDSKSCDEAWRYATPQARIMGDTFHISLGSSNLERLKKLLS